MARFLPATALGLLLLASIASARVMRGDAMAAEGIRASKRAQLRNVLRGLQQAAPDTAPDPQLLPDNEPAPAPPSLPEDNGATPGPSDNSGMTTGAQGGGPRYPPWAPLPPNSPGDIRRDPDSSGSNGAPPYPPWYWPGSSWTSPPQEPSLLERVAGGLSGLARDLGLMDIIDFVQEVAPLLPEIASDIGTVAGYVDKLIQNPDAASLLDANGASGEALFETLRDTLLVMLSTDTGSTFADDLLDSQDVDLAAAATAEDLPSMLRELGNGVIVSDLSKGGDDYQIADFALGFVEVAAGIVEEAVRPDGRLSILTVVTDFLSVAAQAADTFSIHFADAAVQADQVQYQDGPQWLALRRLTTNLRSVSDSLSRLEDKLK
ncbi:hypothetical protein CHLRE_03g191400v5 [Chlamydomonas reinhardtii]|uniref:Uncharacterized protein n=1 Tax=Chlamydomonas reinhardtii TaxID=3055 RepID=A0A2K3DYE6_CHLRE|nr:uncharacterized protein CHLRE_03g191400v5 [Chlamydomonas reinhardtii]PNW85539.1 hypothetical protein CHLRE_03g191400v5 [Chlamydomonas reinhardtii]